MTQLWKTPTPLITANTSVDTSTAEPQDAADDGTNLMALRDGDYVN